MGNIIAIQESEQTLFGSIELEMQICCPLKYLLNRHISLTSKIPEMLIIVGRLLFLKKILLIKGNFTSSFTNRNMKG